MKNLSIHSSELPITLEDITNLEERLNIKLPEDFKTFYLQNNGGYPNADRNVGEEFNSPFEMFLSIKHGDYTIEEQIRKDRNQNSPVKGKIPFATTGIGDIYYMETTPEKYGEIFTYGFNRLEYHCASFTDLLKGMIQSEYYEKVISLKHADLIDKSDTTFYERYCNGEYEQVYNDIRRLGQEAFSPKYWSDIDAVLTETFTRVAKNIQIIYEELKKINYVFQDRPYHIPLSNTEELLSKLESYTKTYGYIPHSLIYFYKIVGGVDFTWNYNKEACIPWSVADPIQIRSLDEISSEDYLEYWQEDIQDYVDDEEEFGYAFLELSADDLHKDNVSGGSPYCIKLTDQPSIDTLFLNEWHDTTFINYLRQCIAEGYGFPGNPKEESFKQYVESIKNKIQYF